jgi:hypothetical protein
VIVTTRGRIYRFGNAPRIPSFPSRRVHGEAIGAIITGDDKGVFLATSSGQVLGLGTARNERIPVPSVTSVVRAIVPAPVGNGYWLVTASGGVSAAGSAEQVPVLTVPPGVVIAASSAY